MARRWTTASASLERDGRPQEHEAQDQPDRADRPDHDDVG
jgi:hypothetical protein